MSANILTQSRVRSLFRYEPSTGWLIRRVSMGCNKAQKNSIAGSKTSDGRSRCMVDRKVYLQHHLVWLYHTGRIPKMIDHIDRNPLNNRIENLRIATGSQNQANASLRKNKTSRYKGVCRKGNGWQSQTGVNGKQIYLGLYNTQEEARDVYQSFMTKQWGEYFAP